MIKIGADRFRSKAAASPESGAGSGGSVDDISKQLANIERMIVELRTRFDTALPHLATKSELQSLTTALPHLATKSELQSLRADLATALPHLATKAEVQSMRVEIEALRADLIKWIVGAALSSVAAATAITTVASRVSWH